MFELLVLVTDEFPQLCVGVRNCSKAASSSQQLQFDIVELNGAPASAPGRPTLLRRSELSFSIS